MQKNVKLTKKNEPRTIGEPSGRRYCVVRKESSSKKNNLVKSAAGLKINFREKSKNG